MRKFYAGLDLSLTDTGVAVIDDRERLCAVKSIKSGTSDGYRCERYDYIAATLWSVLEQYTLEAIFIEDYAYSRPTSLATLGELGGVVKDRLWKETGIPECWVLVIASAVKKDITGSGGGKGGKERMIAAAQPLFDAFGYAADHPYRSNDNVADAIGIARHGLHKLRG